MIDALRNHPGQALILIVTAIGALVALGLLIVDIGDWRYTRPHNGQAHFMSLDVLQAGMVRFAISVLFFLIALRGIVSAEQAVRALPVGLRPAVLKRMRALSRAQVELALLWVGAVLLILLDGVRSVVNHWLFNRRYGRRSTPREGER